MKKVNRKIDTNFEPYLDTVIHFSDFYVDFFTSAARNNVTVCRCVDFKATSEKENNY